ncbi:MAG: DUF3108 domain-containing protein [Limnohabitans sp.]|nr:DUF3108 domain-containing protein [Limnohabitans sp.]
MQPFYPSPLKQGLAPGLLLLLVVALHLAGLHSIATLWPSHLQPGRPVPLSLSAGKAAGDSAPETPAPASAAPPPSAVPAPASPAVSVSQGLHAVNVPEEEPQIDDEQAAKPQEAVEPQPAEPAPPEPVQPPAVAAATPPPPAPPPPVPFPPPASSPPVQPSPQPASAEAASAPSNSPKSHNNAAKETAAGANTTVDNTPPWLAQARFVWPASTKFIYEVLGESKGIRFHADGDMLWRHDGKNYEMRLEIRFFLLGSNTQTSVGQLSSTQGLQPRRFGDKYKQEVTAHFDRDKGQLIFSASSNPQPLLPASQDRLSMFAQLPALLAGTPGLRQSGQQISFQVVAAKSADIWTFQVDKEETVQLPVGKVSAWKLSRVFKGSYDQTAEVWLSPAYGYLPVKLRIAQSNGDVLEQNLSKVQAP